VNILATLSARDHRARGELEQMAEELSKKDIANDRRQRVEMRRELEELRGRYCQLRDMPMSRRGSGRMVEMSLIIKKGKALQRELGQAEEYKSIKQHLGDDPELAEALVLQLIMDLYLFLNVSHSFNPDQFRPTAKMVLAKSKGLTIEELTICFHKVKANEYKSSYGRLDGQVILGWLEQYKKERRERLAQQQQNLHLSTRFHSERLNERILTRAKKVGK